jgi:hypothetical protein
VGSREDLGFYSGGARKPCEGSGLEVSRSVLLKDNWPLPVSGSWVSAGDFTAIHWRGKWGETRMHADA